MRDILLDIITHIDGLKGINTVKITGTETETKLFTKDEARSVIINGKFKTPNTDLVGVFGIPNLNRLKTIIGFDEYGEDAIFEVRKSKEDDSELTPTSFHFESPAGDFVNDFRLMGTATVESQLKELSFKLKTWDVEFSPSVASIQRLKRQAQANSEETSFRMTTENGALKVMFGDAATTSGNFVFEPNVKAKISPTWHWPVEQINFILSLVGDKTFYINNQGASRIIVDSGLIEYEYIVPAQTK